MRTRSSVVSFVKFYLLISTNGSVSHINSLNSPQIEQKKLLCTWIKTNKEFYKYKIEQMK